MHENAQTVQVNGITQPDTGPRDASPMHTRACAKRLHTEAGLGHDGSSLKIQNTDLFRGPGQGCGGEGPRQTLTHKRWGGRLFGNSS